MTCTSDFSPLWSAQNPALSGDRNGWSNCAAYVGAYAASYSSCGLVHPTGAYVRSLTNEPVPDPHSPGLTIIQVQDALARLKVPVTTFTKMAWSDVANLVNSGHYVSLCVGYSVIRPTSFSGDPNFYGGHQIGVPPGWEVQDPLCDGRRAGIYRYHHEAYPVDLVKRAAGAFVVHHRATNGSIYAAPIGLGWAQGFYTLAHPAPTPPPATHTLHIATGTKTILTANLSGSCIASWTSHPWSGVASSAPCGPAKTYPGCAHGSAQVVPVTAGVFAGKLVRIGGGTSVS